MIPPFKRLNSYCIPTRCLIILTSAYKRTLCLYCEHEHVDGVYESINA